MIRVFFSFLFIVLAFSGSSQQNKHKDKVEYIKRYDYRIEIRIWNDFSFFKRTYILDNSSINFYDSTDERNGELKPMILYCITNNSIVDKPDTARVSFTKKDADKLFSLTRNFFKTFRFSNIDTVVNDTKSITVISDDAQAMVELNLGERKVSGTIYSISNPKVTTREFILLLNYIKRFNSNLKNNSR